MPGELTDESLWSFVDRDAPEPELVVRPRGGGNPHYLSAPVRTAAEAGRSASE